jgi:tetratricopeptide (TPR) repeat protein
MLAASAIALTLTVPDRAWAQSQMTARDVLALARQLSTAGDLASAESTYLEILTAYPDAPRDVRGAAYFGRAFAAQQRLDEGSGTTPLDTILSYYAQAKELSRRSTRIAADNNSGLALQSAGRFADAVRYFNAAAREVSGAERAQYLMNAGRAHEAAESWSDASRSYERALDADTTASEALRGLLRVLMHAARADLVLDKMDRWRNDSINAAVVVQAIPELMLRERMALNTAFDVQCHAARSAGARRAEPPAGGGRHRSIDRRLRRSDWRRSLSRARGRAVVAHRLWRRAGGVERIAEMVG